jgi:hypothetical protein
VGSVKVAWGWRSGLGNVVAGLIMTRAAAYLWVWVPRRARTWPRDTAGLSHRAPDAAPFLGFIFPAVFFPAIHDLHNDDTWRSGQNGTDR